MCKIHTYIGAPSLSSLRMTEIVENPELRDLHLALLQIVAVINRPERDAELIRQSGIKLERALFPLLIGIERFGPIGVVELADGVGRDYTTVSRQVARLASLKLVERRVGTADRRTRLISVTGRGKTLASKITRARESLARSVFSSWNPAEFQEFVRLTRKFADAIREPGNRV